MQIKSINYVKASDIPKSTRNSELGETAGKIAEALAKMPADAALRFEPKEVKRWSAYAIKKALADRYHMDVTVNTSGGILFIRNVKAVARKAS
jgi:hypothetical protein